MTPDQESQMADAQTILRQVRRHMVERFGPEVTAKAFAAEATSAAHSAPKPEWLGNPWRDV